MKGKIHNERSWWAWFCEVSKRRVFCLSHLPKTLGTCLKQAHARRNYPRSSKVLFGICFSMSTFMHIHKFFIQVIICMHATRQHDEYVAFRRIVSVYFYLLHSTDFSPARLMNEMNMKTKRSRLKGPAIGIMQFFGVRAPFAASINAKSKKKRSR